MSPAAGQLPVAVSVGTLLWQAPEWGWAYVPSILVYRDGLVVSVMGERSVNSELDVSHFHRVMLHAALADATGQLASTDEFALRVPRVLLESQTLVRPFGGSATWGRSSTGSYSWSNSLWVRPLPQTDWTLTVRFVQAPGAARLPDAPTGTASLPAEAIGAAARQVRTVEPTAAP